MIFIISCTENVQVQTKDGIIEYWNWIDFIKDETVDFGDLMNDPYFITLKESGITLRNEAYIYIDSSNILLTTINLNNKIKISERPYTRLKASLYWIDFKKKTHNTIIYYTVPDTNEWIWRIDILGDPLLHLYLP